MRMSYVVDMSRALAWPLVTALALVLFRSQLGRALEGLGERASKFSVSGFLSIELTPAVTVSPDWHVDMQPGSLDVRRLTEARVFDSYAASLFDQLAVQDEARVAVIDLGRGDMWLTSRLFLFTLLLRNRGVRCLAFTHTRCEVPHSLLGLALPDDIRWALAQTSPWLEVAWAEAYSSNVTGQTPGFPGPHGAVSPAIAMSIARSFVEKIQSAGLPPGNDGRWQEVPAAATSIPTWEHTEWVRPDALDERIDAVLDRGSRVLDDVSTPSKERARKVMLQRGPFVALVDGDNRLVGVVERYPLTDAVIWRVLEDSSQRAAKDGASAR
jgi:hypothetical protein